VKPLGAGGAAARAEAGSTGGFGAFDLSAARRSRYDWQGLPPP